MKAVTIVSLALGLIFPALAIETVPVLDVEKYTGRWYQLYGNEFTARITRDGTCVAADYGLDQATGNITVINSSRIHSPTGELNTITGYAYGTDPSTPGQLKVHLGQVPQDGDYWVVGLGPATFGPDGLYEWAIVSGPDAESLFVLVRDVPDFEKTYARDVLAFVVELGFTGRSKEPQRVIQEGCLPFHPTEFAAAQKDQFEWANILANVKLDEEVEVAYASDEDVNESGTLPEILFLSNLLQDDEKYTWTPDFSPVKPVTKLDVGRYVGRWYQVYSSLTVNVLLGQEAACVTADYHIDKRARNVACVNTARMGGPDGELAEIEGYAYVQDKTKPGELTVHLDGVEAEAPYWIVALGNADGNGPYTYTIVSDPLRAFLFVLVRDPEGFTGSQAETDLLAKCKELGFTSPWNSPRKTVQAGCSYPPDATEAIAHHDKSDAISSVLNLRGGAFGCLPPLHASCKMTFKFPENSCAEVSNALVSSAESMMGFDSCNGGNKCGYMVGKVADGSVELVHETSVKHYKDSLTFTLTDKGDSCEAAAFSTSQTTYAILDNSVNYCNLHNLVDASGLEYAENDVSDCSCTQYSTADCERY